MNNAILKVAMNGLLVGEWRKLTNGRRNFNIPQNGLILRAPVQFHYHCLYPT